MRHSKDTPVARRCSARFTLCAALGMSVGACGSDTSAPTANNTAGTTSSAGGAGATTAGNAGSNEAGAATAGAASGGTGGTNGGGAAGSAGQSAAGESGGTAGTGGNAGAAGAAGSSGNGGNAGAAGAMGGCPAGALLCEDFESYTTPAELSAAWAVTETMATVVVDDTKVHAGARGLHITGSGQTPVGVLVKEGAPIFPITGNVFYGRMMLWLTDAPTGGVHWNNVQSTGLIPDSTQWSKYGWGGMFGTVLAGYTIRDDPAGAPVIDCSKPSQMALPEGQWTCFEWQFDGVGNEMHLWLDGALIADADIITTGTECVTPEPPNNTWQAPTFGNLTVGWAQYQPSEIPIELWLDDVVIATERVGCPTP